MENNNIDKISKAFLSAQKEIKHAEKNSENQFFNNSYANLESVIEACKDVLNKHKISYTQGYDYNVIEGEHIFYVTTTLIHESGQTMSNKVGLPVTKKDPHGVGSLCTYGRRYGLSAIVGISQADDDGIYGSEPPSADKTKLLSKKQQTWIMEECVKKKIENIKWSPNETPAKFGQELVDLICKGKPTQEQADELFDKINKSIQIKE